MILVQNIGNEDMDLTSKRFIDLQEIVSELFPIIIIMPISSGHGLVPTSPLMESACYPFVPDTL